MSRYSASGAPHLQSAFSSPLASSLAAGLAYPADLFHYNPYSALTPTSPLTPSSFWSLTAQQSMTTIDSVLKIAYFSPNTSIPVFRAFRRQKLTIIYAMSYDFNDFIALSFNSELNLARSATYFSVSNVHNRHNGLDLCQMFR